MVSFYKSKITTKVIKRIFKDVLSRPADEFENDQSVEALWAMKAYEHAEIYFNVSALGI